MVRLFVDYHSIVKSRLPTGTLPAGSVQLKNQGPTVIMKTFVV